MNGAVTAQERAALLQGYEEAMNAACNAELAARVNADAEAATALPDWWPFAAVTVVVLVSALSAVMPWGWAA